LKDEQAGEAIAQSEQKEALAEDGAGEEPAEPEDKTISYTDYLAQLAEKKLALDNSLKVREANEGSKLDKKWANAKALEKDEEDVYVAGTHGKKQRERERKVKQTIDFDPRFVEPERTRGGRGGATGSRGGRGGRGGERGRGGDRGRGTFRGGRGGRENAAPINTRDESAFPSLGGK
jgi:plasminogen activator inhibitor 1 RNA-binding protein